VVVQSGLLVDIREMGLEIEIEMVVGIVVAGVALGWV
jgi:hypothetical protein